MSNLDLYKTPFKVALSVTLFYWLAFYMDWNLPMYGAIAIAAISLDTSGASLQKGLLRVVGTTAGLIFGLILLILFLQSRWLNMFGISIYLTICVYFMLRSKYPYAWQVTAFLPIIMWGDSYNNPQYAFDYSIYRYLETTAGVVIYTLVDTLFWPKKAIISLNKQSVKIAQDIHGFFTQINNAVVAKKSPEKIPDEELNLIGELSIAQTTLQQAFTDTSAIKEQKEVWEDLLLQTKEQYSAISKVAESLQDIDKLGGESHQWIQKGTNKIALILDRIDALWQDQITGKVSSKPENDAELLQPLELFDASKLSKGLSRFDRIALQSFLMQLEVIDKTSRKIVEDLKVLTAQETSDGFEPDQVLLEQNRRLLWDPVIFKKAFIPAIIFMVGYVFWIYTNPVGGSSVPSMMGIFGITVVGSNVGAKGWISVMKVIGFVILFVVGPIYFFIMPLLTGYQILALLFVYAFTSTLLGKKSSILKTFLLNILFGMAGLANMQTYSFYTIADGMLMMLIVLWGIALILYVLNPNRPEENMNQKMRAFFHSCSKILGNVNLKSSATFAAGYKERERYFKSVINPIPTEMRGLEKTVNYKDYPEGSKEKVAAIVNGLQNISFKINDLEKSNQRFVEYSSEVNELFGKPIQNLQKKLIATFDQWSKVDKASDFKEDQASIQSIVESIETQLTLWEDSGELTESNKAINMELYAFLGGLRGLVLAMETTQNTLKQLKWDQWYEKRF